MQFRSLVLGAGAASLLALTTGTAVMAADPTTTTSCDNGHWPSTVQGVPTLFKVGATAGEYVWHDSKGWHIRVTHSADTKLMFAGRVVSSAPLDSNPVQLEKSDALTLSADRKTITFRFANFGAVDGFDFTTSCAQRLSFRFDTAGSRTPPSHTWLGHGNRHPLEDPFVVTRIG